MLKESGAILANVQSGPDIFEVSARLPKIAAQAQPGQFVHVRITSGCDPLLRRPFSVYRADPKEGTLSVLYEVVGRGTELLSQRAAGETLDVLGPVGNGFGIPEGLGSALLVAGGMGMPPLVFLAHRLAELGIQTTALVGARSKDRILGREELVSLGAQVEIVTDDGSEGRAGLVSGLVEERLGSDAPGQVFAVGPAAMLRKVIELALDAQIPCQVSLESRMACGVGACLGCVVRVRSTDEQPQYKRVCVDGPVFDAREVLL